MHKITVKVSYVNTVYSKFVENIKFFFFACEKFNFLLCNNIKRMISK